MNEDQECVHCGFSDSRCLRVEGRSEKLQFICLNCLAIRKAEDEYVWGPRGK